MFHKASITLLPKPDSNSRRNCRPTSFMNIERIMLSRIPANWTQQAHLSMLTNTVFVRNMCAHTQKELAPSFVHGHSRGVRRCERSQAQGSLASMVPFTESSWAVERTLLLMPGQWLVLSQRKLRTRHVREPSGNWKHFMHWYGDAISTFTIKTHWTLYSLKTCGSASVNLTSVKQT